MRLNLIYFIISIFIMGIFGTGLVSATISTTLLSPDNNSVSYTSNAILNCSATSTSNLINVSLWTNDSGTWKNNQTYAGVSKFNYSYGIANTASGTITNIWDGLKIVTNKNFSISAVKQNNAKTQVNARICSDYQCEVTTYGSTTFSGAWATFSTPVNLTAGNTYWVLIGGTSETRADISPPNYNLLNNTYFNATGTISPSSGAEISIYSGDMFDIESINITVTSLANNQVISYNSSVTKPTLWSCQACDSTNACAFANENRTILKDSTAPIINITSPSSVVNYGKAGYNLTLNFTAIDTNLDSCWYNYYNATFYYQSPPDIPYTISNPNINISIPCNNASSFLIRDYYSNLLYVYANDTSGNTAYSYRVWNYRIFENNQSYSSQVIEGSSQNFSANLTIMNGQSINMANLWYNGIKNTALIIGNNLVLNNFIIPGVSSNTNLSFFWEVKLSDGSYINLTSRNQSVINLGLDFCSSYSNNILNLTLLDQDLQTKLNGTIELNINIASLSAISQNIASLSAISQNITNLNVCLNLNITNETSYYMDVSTKYYSPGYSVQFYNIQKYIISSSSQFQNISLYDLNSTYSTDFQITFTGTDFLPQSEVIVIIERQYLSENVFKTVEAPITDTNGQTIVHLVKNDIVYNIKFMKNGVLIKSFNNIRAFCNSQTGLCTINLNAISNSSNFDYNHKIGIVYPSPPVYNSSSGLVTFSFSSTDGTIKNIVMNVERSDVFGNVTLCTNSIQTISGSISCLIPAGTSGTNLIVRLVIDGTELINSPIILVSTGYGSIGFVAWFLITLGSILMFSNDKNGVLLAILLSYVGSVSLGLVLGGIIGIGAAGIGLIIVTVIGIWKLNKNKFGS
jgi:hypothetical protein